MSNRDSGGGRTGIGFMGALQLIFIVLKLCKVIEWSWWAVLIPLWIELALCVLVIAFVVIAAIVKGKTRDRNRRERIKW